MAERVALEEKSIEKEMKRYEDLQEQSLDLRAKKAHMDNRITEVAGKLEEEEKELQNTQNKVFGLEEEKLFLEKEIDTKKKNNSDLIVSIEEKGARTKPYNSKTK